MARSYKLITAADPKELSEEVTDFLNMHSDADVYGPPIVIKLDNEHGYKNTLWLFQAVLFNEYD